MLVSLLGGTPNSYNALMVIRLRADPGSTCTLGIGVSLIYAMKYKGLV